MSQTDMFSAAKEQGYVCPHCGQFVKTYTRKLNSSMALVLILIFRSGYIDYFHVEDWLKKIGRPELRADFHKLTWFGLLEKKSGKREDGSKRNGHYKITGRGMAFCQGEYTVKEKVKIFNNNFQGFAGEEVNIKKCLGNKFNYDELMKEV